MSKLWGGRFSKDADKLMHQFNSSIHFDKRLYKQDIRNSIAHTDMLAKQKIISAEDKHKIIHGLKEIESEIDTDKFKLGGEFEDIHTAVEHRLQELIGAAAGRLHTGRSRNDQVATDVHLFLKETIASQLTELKNLLAVLIQLADAHQETILPGYTHLQAAQPITLAFHFLAYFFKFERDTRRFRSALDASDNSPLGAGAFAGANYPLDRQSTARALGFKSIYANAMDAVSDRDFILDYVSAAAILATHLSRFNEELILWSNTQFGFIEMDDAYSTGSSLMPHKKNPDACELIRGKTGRIYGALTGLLTILKSQPLAYNKDLQEDKELLFDTADTISQCLAIFPKLLESMTVCKEKMRAACEKGFLEATDIADYLVRKGLPFRQAHHLCGELVKYLLDKGKTFAELTLDEYKQISDTFTDDVFETVKLETLINNKQSAGSTSYASVKDQLALAGQLLKKL